MTHTSDGTTWAKRIRRTIAALFMSLLALTGTAAITAEPAEASFAHNDAATETPTTAPSSHPFLGYRATWS